MKASKMRKTSKPTVFISFNNKDSKFVDSLEKEINRNARIIRYENGVSSWGSFTVFMEKIRHQDFSVLIISENYLKSLACLHEVQLLMCESNWQSKTMFVIMNSNINIYTSEGRHEYIEFWNEYCAKLNTKIITLPKTSTLELQKDLASAEKVRDNIDVFLHFVADTNNPPIYTVIPEIKERLKNEHVMVLTEMAAAAEVSKKIRKKSPNQQRVIRMLCTKDRITCQEIAADLEMTSGVARYALDQLVNKGIAQKEKINRRVFYYISV